MITQLLEGSPLKVVFDNVEEGIPSTSFRCNNNIQCALIEVKGADTIELYVSGCASDTDAEGKALLEDEDCYWVDLALIKASDYSIVDKIEDNGLYYVNLGGMARVSLYAETLVGTPTITLVRVE